MYLLRLQAIVNGQPQLLKQVAIYYADTSTVAVLFDPVTEQPSSNILRTDASGFVTFKMLALNTLTFRLLIGLTPSTAAYPLYDGISTPPPQLNPIPVAYWEDVPVSPLMLTVKSLTLQYNPIDVSVELSIYKGILQERNVDYVLTGQTITWDSLGLEALLELGDTLHLTYFREQ
jgi:hypothetical protein